jgi:hypothetical protein
MDSNHCEVVRESIIGERAIDEQTFAALAILNERLERLRKLNKVFSAVAFSSAVKKLKRRNNKVLV